MSYNESENVINRCASAYCILDSNERVTATAQVGIGATQLGKHLGLTVIGTAGYPEGIELVKGIGAADFAFNHNDPTYMEQIKV